MSTDNANQKPWFSSAPRMATKAQVDYMLLLFNDLGYGTIAHRKAWLEKREFPKVMAIGDLTLKNASRAIGMLVEERDGKKQEREEEDRMQEVDLETEDFWTE